MTEMEPGPLGQQHLQPRDTSLPMITLDFDGGSTVSVTVDGLNGGDSVYGVSNESEPTQALTSTGGNTYAGSYTSGTDTTYTIEVGPSSGSPLSAVLTVNIPASAQRVRQRSQRRPDVVAAVCSTTGQLHVASAPDGSAFGDPGATSLGLATTVQPAAATLAGLPSVAAVVAGGIQMRQLRDGAWQTANTNGLPGAGVGGIALVELGGRAYLALTLAATVQIWQASSDLLSTWTREASFSTPGQLADIGLGTDGRRLMLGWTESQTLNVAAAEYDAGGGLVWSVRGPVLVNTKPWSAGPSLAANGSAFVLGCTDQDGLAWTSRTNDFGVTWTPPEQPFSDLTNGPLALTRHFGRLYLSAVVAGGQARVMRSSNGLSWSDVVTLNGANGQPWAAGVAPSLAGGPAIQPG